MPCSEEDSSVVETLTTASGQIKSFDGTKQLSGRLVVGAPDERAVSHDGIEIILRTVARIHDGSTSDQEQTVMEKRWTLLEPGSISEPIEIPFDIDLSRLADLRHARA